MLRALAALSLLIGACGGPLMANPDNGPCRLPIDNGAQSISVSGWCVRGEPALLVHGDQIALLSDALVVVDRATGARSTLVAPSSDLQPYDFVDGGDEVFFAACSQSSCGIYVIPWTGGVPRAVESVGVPTTADQVTRPLALAVDAQSLYWVAMGGIFSAPRAGGTPRRLGDAPTGYFDDFGLAVTTTALYVTDDYSASIERLPLDGSAPTAAPTLREARGPIARGDTVYWLEQTTMGDTPSRGGMVRAWSGAGGPTTLVDGIIGLGGFAFTADAVVWTSAPEIFVPAPPPHGTVEELVQGATAPTTIADAQLAPHSVIVDGTTAYWVETGWDGSSAVVNAPLP